jgi:hypothetical protein
MRNNKLTAALAILAALCAPAGAEPIGLSLTGWLAAPEPEAPSAEDEYGGPTNQITDSDSIGVIGQQYWNYTPTWQPSMGWSGWDPPNDRQADFPDTGSIANLKDSSGAMTGVSVSWEFLGNASDGLGWSQNEYTKPEPADKNCKMMNGLLWGIDAAGSNVSFSGLSNVYGSGTYDVIVYVDIWEIGGVKANIDCGGPTIEFQADVDYGDPDATEPAATCVFDDATSDLVGNYVKFTGLSGDTLTVHASPAAGESMYWVSGIQIVPEPATVTFIVVGGLGVWLLRKRRR